ncbi:HEPN domain-containing protein [Novosphingobium sp.]|uniref:HEPN domain-containing protein n=1 Tax=Novosphingobium sp. TaxID=1874826 RepID=UPI002FE19373
MKTSLEHLPARKQHELERLVRVIFEEFNDAHGVPTGQRKMGRILKIVLYGSFARGNWVNEPTTGKGYQSDFDILIIVNQPELTDWFDYWEKVEERLSREREISGYLNTPVQLIVHTLQEVNDGLSHGRYFFLDIADDGIAIYQADESELARPQPKTPAGALKMAEDYFDDLFPYAMSRFQIARYGMKCGFLRDAAFDLHQTVERLYQCVLLVCTFYTPRAHNVNFLRNQAEKVSGLLVDVWPRESKRDRARFEKLKDAYVKGRYSKHFTIDNEELEWLASRIEELGQAVHKVCAEKIAELRSNL